MREGKRVGEGFAQEELEGSRNKAPKMEAGTEGAVSEDFL